MWLNKKTGGLTMTDKHTFEQEIERIADEGYSFAWRDGAECLNRRDEIVEEVKRSIKSLLASTVEGCIPEKKYAADVEKFIAEIFPKVKKGSNKYTQIWNQITDNYMGRNEAIDTFTTNLKEKGVI